MKTIKITETLLARFSCFHRENLLFFLLSKSEKKSVKVFSPGDEFMSLCGRDVFLSSESLQLPALSLKHSKHIFFEAFRSPSRKWKKENFVCKEKRRNKNKRCWCLWRMLFFLQQHFFFENIFEGTNIWARFAG